MINMKDYQIVQKKILNENVIKMDIYAPMVAKRCLAGQFVILRVDKFGERIPLTIADYDRDNGIVSIIFVLCYLLITHAEVHVGQGFVFNDCLLVAVIIGISMLVSITLSSVIGTCFPLLLTKLKIDPAVASGPFITTLNDVIAVIVYYGLTFLLFIILI